MKSTNFKYLWLLPFVVMASCQVSKDVQLPKPSLPVTFNGAADTISTADLSYKEFFTDPQLRELIDSALIRNFDLQVALKNIEESQLLVKQVKWNNVPTVDINVTASSQRPSNNSITGLSLKAFGVGTNHIEDYTASLAISWEADIWAKVRNQSRSALATYLQTQEARKAVQTSIVTGVAQGYYNLLMLTAQLRIAKRNVALNDSTLRMISLQFESGQTTSLAVEQAKTQQLTAAELVPQLEQNITIQEDAISRLAGKLPSKIDLSGSLETISLLATITTGVPAAILSRRPDVKSRELALTVANASVGINQAQMYPAFRITASGGLDAYKASDWFNIPNALFGIVGGSILQPLLEHKQLKTNFEVAKAKREKSVIQFRQSVNNAVGEVYDALSKWDKTREQETIARERVATSQRATYNATQLYKSGLATYLEVITAQANALQSELDLAAVKRSELSASAELYIALGGGWK